MSKSLGLRKPRCPLESQEGQAFFAWAQYNPIAKAYLYKIQNDGKRSKREGARYKAEGMRPGVSDYHLAYPAHGKPGLWIELKRRDKNLSRVTVEQQEWLDKMRALGFATGVAYGAREAMGFLEDYLSGRMQ